MASEPELNPTVEIFERLVVHRNIFMIVFQLKLSPVLLCIFISTAPRPGMMQHWAGKGRPGCRRRNLTDPIFSVHECQQTARKLNGKCGLKTPPCLSAEVFPLNWVKKKVIIGTVSLKKAQHSERTSELVGFASPVPVCEPCPAAGQWPCPGCWWSCSRCRESCQPLP